MPRPRTTTTPIDGTADRLGSCVGSRAASPGWLRRLDARDRLWLVQLAARRPTATECAAWRALTHVGGATVTTVACALPFLVALRYAFTSGSPVAAAAAWRLGWLTTAIVVLSHLAVQIVKRTVGRPRPATLGGVSALAAEPDRFSFPSGHSAAAMAVAIAYGSSIPPLLPLLVALAVLVGLSRAILGVHYLGDIVAGQVLALLAGAVLAVLPLGL